MNSPTHRVPLVDTLRGIAVVAMVYIHVEHAFGDPARISASFDGDSNYFGGWAAPTFLFLAGLSAAWASEKTNLRTLARRGLEVWLWGMAFRAVEWISGGSGARARDMLRVDVLNCIGVSLMLAAGALAIMRRNAILLALTGAAIFMLTPWARAAAPDMPLGWYIGGPQQMSPFPIFGWSGFAFFGAALGTLATGAERNRTLLKASAIGVILYLVLFLLRSFSPAAVGYACSDFNPYNMFERLALTVALFLPANALKPLHGWLTKLGRHSMIIYWVHVELCYGLLLYHFQHTLGMAGVLAAAAVMMGAMSFLATGQERLVDWANQTMRPALKRSVRT